MKLITLILIAIVALNSINADSSLNNLSSCIFAISNPCTTQVVTSDPQCSSNLAYYGVCIGACGVTTTLSNYKTCAASCTTSDNNLSNYAQAVQTCIIYALKYKTIYKYLFKQLQKYCVNYSTYLIQVNIIETEIKSQQNPQKNYLQSNSVDTNPQKNYLQSNSVDTVIRNNIKWFQHNFAGKLHICDSNVTNPQKNYLQSNSVDTVIRNNHKWFQIILLESYIFVTERNSKVTNPQKNYLQSNSVDTVIRNNIKWFQHNFAGKLHICDSNVTVKRQQRNNELYQSDATTSSASFISSLISSQTNPCIAASSDTNCAANIAIYALCLGGCGSSSSLADFQSCALSCTVNDSAISSFFSAASGLIGKAITS
ncbi:hypothetical protein ABPG72_016451 [Tetrahymena utriculariae]